jgi:hypothetical protein
LLDVELASLVDNVVVAAVRTVATLRREEPVPS